MQKEKFFTALTYKICQRTLVRADGSNTIILRVIIDRKKRDYNLNINWPAKYFNLVSSRAMPINKKDTSHHSINLVIETATAKAHHIKMTAFAKQKELTHEQFAREFENYESKENFIWYWRDKMTRRYHSGMISAATYKRHCVSLDNGMVKFCDSGLLEFNKIDLDLIIRYDIWLRRVQKYMHNTICGYLKDMKTYINQAIKDGYQIKNPFKEFKYKYRDGFREPLDMDELKTLIAMLDKPMSDINRSVLERFLFSCFTGIRISDVSRVTIGMVHNGVLSVKMKKGDRFGKSVHIPLPQIALKLIEGRKGKLFEPLADQTCNDTLKIIAGIAGITKNLTYHVSRDTFGTQFIEMGGDPVTLKELMGHTNIATTMIYVKISEKRKELLMSNFDKHYTS